MRPLLKNLDLYWSESLCKYIKTCTNCLAQRKRKRIQDRIDFKMYKEHYLTVTSASTGALEENRKRKLNENGSEGKRLVDYSYKSVFNLLSRSLSLLLNLSKDENKEEEQGSNQERKELDNIKGTGKIFLNPI